MSHNCPVISGKLFPPVNQSYAQCIEKSFRGTSFQRCYERTQPKFVFIKLIRKPQIFWPQMLPGKHAFAKSTF